jgi:membrane-bound inhibitor of C-type lysozyme
VTLSSTVRRGMTASALAALLVLAACTAPERERPAATATPAVNTPAASTPATSTATGPTTSAGATGGTATQGGTATGPTATEGVIVPPSPTGTRYEYACAEGKTFAILAYPAAQERVTLFIEGRTLELKQERQGSGTRHSDGTYTLIAKGVDAFIEQGGVQTYRDCKASRP